MQVSTAEDQETKLKRRASVKQKVKKEAQTVAQKVVEEQEEIEKLAQKISEVTIETEEEEELPREPEEPKPEPKAEEKKPKKKSISAPKIEPLVPSTESPEEMVSGKILLLSKLIRIRLGIHEKVYKHRLHQRCLDDITTPP